MDALKPGCDGRDGKNHHSFDLDAKGSKWRGQCDNLDLVPGIYKSVCIKYITPMDFQWELGVVHAWELPEILLNTSLKPYMLK